MPGITFHLYAIHVRLETVYTMYCLLSNMIKFSSDNFFYLVCTCLACILNLLSALLDVLAVKICILPFKVFFYKYCAGLKIHKSVADPDLRVQVTSLLNLSCIYLPATFQIAGKESVNKVSEKLKHNSHTHTPLNRQLHEILQFDCWTETI